MNYHAHVYYDKTTRHIAEQIHQEIASRYSVLSLSRLVDYPVGPHLAPMFQVTFEGKRHQHMIDFFTPFRADVSIMIHPLSGDDLLDHTDKALWIGKKLAVNIPFLESLTQT